jgi:hypothetical protein
MKVFDMGKNLPRSWPWTLVLTGPQVNAMLDEAAEKIVNAAVAKEIERRRRHAYQFRPIPAPAFRIAGRVEIPEPRMSPRT